MTEYLSIDSNDQVYILYHPTGVLFTVATVPDDIYSLNLADWMNTGYTDKIFFELSFLGINSKLASELVDERFVLVSVRVEWGNCAGSPGTWANLTAHASIGSEVKNAIPQKVCYTFYSPNTSLFSKVMDAIAELQTLKGAT